MAGYRITNIGRPAIDIKFSLCNQNDNTEGGFNLHKRADVGPAEILHLIIPFLHISLKWI